MAAALAAAAGAWAPATAGARTTADEPQYLLSAISLAEDGDLDIVDELAGERWRAFHATALPEQTRPLPDGRRVSPHDPLLPLLLAPGVAVAGWLGAKLTLAATAGALAALLLWTATTRFQVPASTAALTVTVFTLSAPLSPYGAQIYPELPAALAVTVATAALATATRRAAERAAVPAPAGATATAAAPSDATPGAPGRATEPAAGRPPVRAAAAAAASPAPQWVWVLAGAVVALPWLAGKYIPVAGVLAGLGLWRLVREGRRTLALELAGGLAVTGVVYLVVHQVVWTGWTVYASGDHFAESGELGVVGFAPDYWGRSRRLIGLLVDRTFGIAAWQPAWLLVVPAVAAVRRAVLLVPLAAGWLVATFVALTMHGWWFPGRQVVVVLPAAVLAVACWATTDRRRVALLALGAVGIVNHAWLTAEALTGRLTWVVDFAATANPIVRAWRILLPDYLDVTAGTWVLHALWLGYVAWSASRTLIRRPVRKAPAW